MERFTAALGDIPLEVSRRERHWLGLGTAGIRMLTLFAIAACGSHPPAPAPAPVQNSAVDVAHACEDLHPADALMELPHGAIPLAGTTVDGAAFDLAKLRGKAVLVAFEAPWATVSQKDDATMPALAQALGSDLAIVRVASAESVAEARERVPAGVYANVFDKPPAECNIGPQTHSWGVDLVPESFLVDRAGNIRMHFVNWRDWSSPEALACVRAVAADHLAALAPRAFAVQPQHCSNPAAGGGRVSGTIRMAPGVRAKAGTAIFVMARRQGKGPPLAVAKLTYTGGDVPFVLDDSNAMIAGTSLAGELEILARYDQDGDALSRQHGDYSGRITVTAPATGVTLVIDTPFQ